MAASLVPGQTVSATVLARHDGGRVDIALFGQRVEAFSEVALTEGRTYEFQIAATRPRLVLTAVRAVPMPALGGAADAGLLGPSAADVARLLSGFVASLAGTPGPGAAGTATGAGAGADFAAAFLRLSEGRALPSDLALVHERLGHDQEARVLRLPPSAEPERPLREVSLLRDTLKARALRIVDAADPDAPETTVRRSARALIDGLSRIEGDNAQRSERGAPIWLPLPVGTGAVLRDARMFLVHPDADHQAAEKDTDDARPLSIVLLLDFTALGEVRADVRVHAGEVSVRFQLVDVGACDALHAGLCELRAALERQGLGVASLDVRLAPSVPVADLAVPPRAGGPATIVDLRV